MIDDTDIEEEFEKYNNFENYADIAKYLLLNPANHNYIHNLMSTMEFDDIENISYSIKLVIKLLDKYNVNISTTLSCYIYKMIQTEEGKIPEIEMHLDKDFVHIKRDDIYLFNEQNIGNMIYNSLQEYDFKEVNEKISEAEIENIIYQQTMRGIKSYTRNKDLIIGKGNTTYDIPIQLIIYRILKKRKKYIFMGMFI